MINNEIKGHFLNLYQLALSDNYFDEMELDTILTIGEEKGISRAEFEQIIINPSSVEIKYPTEFTAKIELLYDFVRVIWADQKVQPDEEQAFLKFGERFGFSTKESEDLLPFLLGLAKQNIPSSNIEKEILKATE